MSTDPFDRLGATNPVPDPGGLPDPRTDPAAMALLDRILGADAADAAVRRRHRGRRILIPVMVAVAVTTAAAAWIVTRPADDPTQVACFREVDLHADIVGVEPVAGDPAAGCAEVWEHGEFRDGPAPVLEACVLDSGIVGVFPATGGDPCGRLGLDRARPTSELPPIVGVQDRLADRLGASCVPIADALGLIDDELHAAGLDEWAVVGPAAIPPDRPCASIAIDVGSQTITVVPIPRPPAG